MKPTEVNANLRELIVHLNRRNSAQAESIVDNVSNFLDGILKSKEDLESPPMQRAQQTMFAIDEVRFMLAQRNFGGAAVAARDAVKEWK